MPAVVGVDAWHETSLLLVVLLAGLTALPREPMEAATVDGANRWHVLTTITLPLLAPVMLVAVLIRMIAAMKTYDLIYILTAGGPGGADRNDLVPDLEGRFYQSRHGPRVRRLDPALTGYPAPDRRLNPHHEARRRRVGRPPRPPNPGGDEETAPRRSPPGGPGGRHRRANCFSSSPWVKCSIVGRPCPQARGCRVRSSCATSSRISGRDNG